MGDKEMVLGLLQDGRDMVRADWGSSNMDVDWEEASGRHCASVALIESANLRDMQGRDPLNLAAHVAFLQGAGVKVPTTEDELFAAVYQFNDAQLSRDPVVTAFDRAIEFLSAQDSTPNADMALEVMAGCERLGDVLAGHICTEHPGLDEREIARVASAELFYAAQDTAKASAHGVTYSRA